MRRRRDWGGPLSLAVVALTILGEAWFTVAHQHVKAESSTGAAHIHSAHGHAPRDRHRHLRTAHDVSDLRITRMDAHTHTADSGSSRGLGAEEGGSSPSSLHAPYGNRIRAAFRAFDRDYSFTLQLHSALFDEGAHTRTRDPQGREIVTPVVARAYEATLPHGGWVRATVHGDDVMHAVWTEPHKDGSAVKMMVPLEYYKRSAPHIASAATERGARMLAFHVHDMDLHEHASDVLKWWRGAQEKAGEAPEARLLEDDEKAPPSDEPAIPHRTLQASSGLMTTELQHPMLSTTSPYGVMIGCPSTLYKVSIGVAADAGFTQVLTGFTNTSTTPISAADAVSFVEADIQTQLNIVNVLYVDMANIFLSLAATEVRTTSGSDSWNEQPLDASVLTGANRYTYGCPQSRAMTSGDTDYTATLTNLGTWRNSQSSSKKYAMWHLLTNCYPPAGTVGLAYIGTTCNTGKYGASWASHQEEGTWLTVAHEIGHNFGAYHTLSTGGIMSYDSMATKEVSFTDSNPTQVCSHISSVKGVCYSAMTSTCGNGILEPGEECDDTSACCDLRDCTLVWMATCSYGLDSECCTTSCKTNPTTTTCTLQGSDGVGYCYNGMCHPNSLAMSYSNLGGCAAPTTAPCKESVSYSSNCGYTDSNFGLSGYNMPDGAYCNSALNRICSSGSCVSTPTPAPAPAPSRSPTTKPTPYPTTTPSLAPTVNPTNAPTVSPTKSPTKSPSKSPTKSPTKAPTKTPTPA